MLGAALRQLFGGQPERFQNAGVQFLVRVVPPGLGDETGAVVYPGAFIRLKNVPAEQAGDLHPPGGFLQGFPVGGLHQVLAEFGVAGGLVDHRFAVLGFAHEQQAAFMFHHGGDCNMRLEAVHPVPDPSVVCCGRRW